MEERDPLLSQAYREAAHPEPSPALDARILAAARQAVARPVRRRAAWLNWAVPLSTTAVLVLGITLLFNIQREAPETLREAVPSPAPARPEPALSFPSESPPGTRAESAAQPAPAAKASRDTDAAASSGAARGAMKPGPAGPASGPVPAPGALPPIAPGQNAASAPAAESSAGAAPEPRPFPAQSAPALQAPPAAGLSSQDSARMERPAPPAAASAREAAPAFSQGMGKLKAASPEREGPEQWVESIRRLLREGRTDEARKSLEELRKRYPGYGLPEDLRGLAGK